jgi:hypothetical protein
MMSDATNESSQDILQRVRLLAQPLVQSLDAKVRDEVEKRVDDVVRDRLSTIERAISDLDRSIKALEARLDARD